MEFYLNYNQTKKYNIKYLPVIKIKNHFDINHKVIKIQFYMLKKNLEIIKTKNNNQTIMLIRLFNKLYSNSFKLVINPLSGYFYI